MFLYFFKLLRVLSLRMLVEFSLTCIFQHVWKYFFNIWCSHSQKIIESMLFHSYPSPPLKTPGRIFWKSVFPKTEGVGRSYDLLCQNSIRKYEDGFQHSFILIWYDCNFSKSDDFTMLWTISNSVVLSLLATSSLQPW